MGSGRGAGSRLPDLGAADAGKCKQRGHFQRGSDSGRPIGGDQVGGDRGSNQTSSHAGCACACADGRWPHCSGSTANRQAGFNTGRQYACGDPIADARDVWLWYPS